MVRKILNYKFIIDANLPIHNVTGHPSNGGQNIEVLNFIDHKLILQ